MVDHPFSLNSVSSSVAAHRSWREENKYLMFFRYFSTLGVLWGRSFLVAGWEILVIPLRKSREEFKSMKPDLWSDWVILLYLYHPALSRAGRRAGVMRMKLILEPVDLVSCDSERSVLWASMRLVKRISL